MKVTVLRRACSATPSLGSRDIAGCSLARLLLVLISLGFASSLVAQPSFAGAFRGRLANGSDIVLSASNGNVGALYVLS